jgi:anti-anti-sigma regulatory factor
MTLKIQRVTDGDMVVFALSGRIERGRVAELQRLLTSEASNHRIVLDLEGVDLVDQATVRFLAACAATGIELERCPAYIREWIVRERDGK